MQSVPVMIPTSPTFMRPRLENMSSFTAQKRIAGKAHSQFLTLLAKTLQCFYCPHLDLPSSGQLSSRVLWIKPCQINLTTRLFKMFQNQQSIHFSLLTVHNCPFSRCFSGIFDTTFYEDTSWHNFCSLCCHLLLSPRRYGQFWSLLQSNALSSTTDNVRFSTSRAV